MYKAVMRNYGPLPWDRVDGQTSWLDPANQTWEELGLDSQEGATVLAVAGSRGAQTSAVQQVLGTEHYSLTHGTLTSPHVMAEQVAD
ncbi:RH47 [Symbiodinium natans]|uniref:RH47 protein n=1 Tax=Symbiodinium natans TaxID=878477 RepID=A0A812N6K4_9DINO|nr:RH47 [Symbiodinium natans]